MPFDINTATIEEIRDELERVQDENDNLKIAIDEHKDEIREFESQEVGANVRADEAIDAFLDCVSRPVGSMAFQFPQSSDTNAPINRAVLGLYDAVGRNI